jgi:nucleoside-diphosphate-sugar epimerase
VTAALVTGAAGFVGSHVAERLAAQGMRVIGVDSLTHDYDPSLKRRNLQALDPHPGFELVTGDLLGLDLAELLEGVGVVYHLAGRGGVRESWGNEFRSYLERNVLATHALLEAVREHPVDRFVLASSSSIYGDAVEHPTTEAALPQPVSPYGVTKLAAEHLCRAYHSAFGVPVVTLRYFSLHGPRQRPDMALRRFIESALAARPVTIYGDGRQTRDFTYVGDAVTATLAAAQRGEPGDVYNIANGSEVTVIEAIETIERLLETKLEVEHLPARAAEPRRTGADVSAARRRLGYSPQTSFEAGVSAQLAADHAIAARGAGKA